MLGREAIIEAILPNHNIPQRILAIRGGSIQQDRGDIA